MAHRLASSRQARQGVVERRDGPVSDEPFGSGPFAD